MDNEEFKETQRERLFAFILQERFDKRYVSDDGKQKLRDSLLFGGIGLFLTSCVLAVAAFTLHIIHLT